VDGAREAEAVLQRYIEAQEAFDLELLMSCWHPDVEIEHPLRPSRGWRGSETYRKIWAAHFASGTRNEIVSTSVNGNHLYLEAVMAHSDGGRTPNMNVFDIEDGMIRRGRVYTDVPVLDGRKITDFDEDREAATRS
jgi:hypothetical protein